MEQWLPLQGYPGYSASSYGRIRNDRRDHILAIVRAEGRRCYVSLTFEGKQVNRSLSLLICETFLQDPRPQHFDTPIHIDGDLTNCRVSNLAWRPRWFANRYTEQFNLNLIDVGPVKNINTGVIYEGVWSIVFEQGVLFNDVVGSIINKTYVFPLMQCFEWA